jgi:alkanesulfonate monooxygenase SsuD/methylene tetrahydromethanopterin reductase-like flavin-dependent oxidoreductase (luciferase family)
VKIGLFLEEMRRGLSQSEAFHDALRLADAAEAWGLEGVWLGEMHCTPDRSVLSAPLLVATAIASRTRRLRVGTAVHLLPLNNPLRIAEEVATLDQLSHGRFEFGIGRSGSPRAYNAYGVPYEESQARFFEALEIIREAWRGEPFTYHGRFHRVTNTTVAPRPCQRPHPPMRMAALSAETFAVVARLGLQLFVGLRQSDLGEVAAQLETYRRAWKDAGHPGEGSVYLRIPLYAAPTEREAREQPRESITYYFQRQAEFSLAGAGQAGTGPVEQKHAKAAELRAMTYEHILAHRVAFGSGRGLVERLTRLRDELGLDGIVVELNPGGLIPAELEARSLSILARDVAPALA